MSTPFDEAVEAIRQRGYHNHRKEDHSDIVSQGIYRDLLASCEKVREDVESGITSSWMNVPAPGARKRKIDLFVGEGAAANKKPPLTGLRIGVENKSVITAHRNKDARFDDLEGVLGTVHSANAEAVLVATVLIGIAERVLNVPDRITPFFEDRPGYFESNILPRLSTGDQSLWSEFPYAVSTNSIPRDPLGSLEKFRQLKQRHPGRTHELGYDYILFVPVYIDNVNPPYVARQNPLGIDVDRDYQAMLNIICKAYNGRWHLL